ncbi:MAG TPA: MOSC domain-containing protein [Anaerolineae bacterium]|nr:MOSC domain-containing protein [Anaerolineae bacterium]
MAHIFQINISPGGVPKFAVRCAEVTPLGLVGDAHHNVKVHGGVRRALCLYSLEHLLALQAEGHPIFPGATGENLTLTGLPWDVLTPGARLRLGVDVRIEITGYTAPCPKIIEAFADGEIRRMSQEAYPGWSRLYAQVLTPGLIGVGDPVRLESAES